MNKANFELNKKVFFLLGPGPFSPCVKSQTNFHNLQRILEAPVGAAMLPYVEADAAGVRKLPE